MKTERTLTPNPHRPLRADVLVVPMPRPLRDLWPRLAERAARMLATGALIDNGDGTYTLHTEETPRDYTKDHHTHAA